MRSFVTWRMKPRKKVQPRPSLTPGNGANDTERFLARRNRFRQHGIRRRMRHILESSLMSYKRII
jgi:hypothetical protein